MLTPWSEVGVDVSDCSNLSEAMTKANVMFNVSIRQGFFTGTSDNYIPAEEYYYMVRDDLEAALGTCRSRFEPLQNVDAFGIIEPFIRESICMLDVIGCFGLGQRVWLLAKIIYKRYEVVPGDEISLYLIVINAHDGSKKVMIGIIPMRVWCSNMFSMLSRSEFEVLKFKHTGDVAEKLRKVELLINEQLKCMEGFILRLKGLTKVWPSPEELDKYFRTLFNIKEGSPTKSENKIRQLKELFIQGRGNQHEKIRGTWYAAYNAVSEYLNYVAGRNPTTRLTSLWFGANNIINSQALELAIKQVRSK